MIGSLTGSFNGAKTTLHLESTGIRILAANGGHARRWDSAPLAPGSVKGGRILDAESAGRSIGKAFDELGYSRTNVVASVSGVMAVSRIIKLPPLNGSDLDKAIATETQRVLSPSANSMHVFTKVVRRDPDEVGVLALGVPIDTIDRQIKALRFAGIQPASLYLKPLAIFKAVDAPTCVVASLEWDTLDIVVAVDGLPEIVRSVMLTSRPGELDAAAGIMQDELTRIVKFYNDSHRGRPLSPSVPIYLAGEQTNRSGFPTSLDLPSGHRVQPCVPALRCPTGLPLAEYLVNVGLALKRS